ncbi:MAG: hypothetical protein ACOYMS_01065 [Terrimicrobiaceae bacterium]
MNKKHLACIVVFIVIILMVQASLSMNRRMLKMQSDAAKAEQTANMTSSQLALERRQLDELRKTSKPLIDYLNLWQPYFAAVDSPQNAELKISLKIKEDSLVTLSQRYEVVPQKNNRSLPYLMRAQVTFEDNYTRVLNWIGRLERELPTMRISSVRVAKGTGLNDLKVDMTLEQPILSTQ